MEKEKMSCLERYRELLVSEEKSPITIEKYLGDGAAFLAFLNGRELSKSVCLEYKQRLMEQYAARSVNSKLASLNSLLRFLGREECRVRALKLQRETYISEERELTRGEYLRLLTAAKKNTRLYLVLQTICATGIRVSELRFFTVEAVRSGTVVVRCKGKTRNVFVPGKLKKLLLDYAKKQKLSEGILFQTRGGKPIDRSNIWAEMKRLCTVANVSPKKVFPHNLRKLFARSFYQVKQDITKLADLLGHSSIDTTRIYIITTGEEHRRIIDRLGLVI